MTSYKKTGIARLAFLFILLQGLFGLISTQNIPQIQPDNSTLGASTSYILSYFSSKKIPTTTKFTVDFTQSNIQITTGIIPCNIKLNNQNVQSPSCSCQISNGKKTCELMPNSYANFNTKVEIQFGGLTNPYYLSTQFLPVNIYFSPSITSQDYTVSILNIFYKPMPIIVNSFKQSEYGVGSTPVSYTFNLSLHYISQNFEMQIQIPNQVTYGTITSELSFYGTVQDIQSMQIQSLLIFNIQTQKIANPDGYLLLTLHGFGNPQYIGDSSSFRIVFQQKQAVTNCATCKIAETSSGLVVQSKNPGDISVLSFSSTSLYIASQTSISINLLLYAGISSGGKVSIYLPPEITPVIPIQCKNVYGFITDDGNQPHCTYYYNETENIRRIDTENFAYPFLVSKGNGIISLQLNNPIDSRRVNFHFETFDNLGRTIGKSRQQYYYSAIPLMMTLESTKNITEVDSIFTLTAEITLQRSISSSQNQIEVILPSEVTYDIDKILCMSAQQNLGCTATLDDYNQLVIRMPPPCVQCAVSNTIKFSISNLKNPSYISDLTQTIYIHTRSQSGIIEASQSIIQLVAAPIHLINYNIPSGQFVGSLYDQTIALILPEYIIANGGKIHLIFQEKTVYCDANIDKNTGEFVALDQQLTITSGAYSIDNQIQYNANQQPASISRIIMNVCTGSMICKSNQQTTLLLKNLRQGYIPAITNTQHIKITTEFGSLIAQKSVDMTGSSPVLKNSPLSIEVQPDVTNIEAKYTIEFSSSNVAFGDSIDFEFSPNQQITSSHCELNTNYPISINYACSNVSLQKIHITHDFNPALMISNDIQYSITVYGVKTPTSTKAINYKLSTYFNDNKNQQFTSSVSINQAYPMTIDFTKTNDTIGQPCILTFNVTPKTMHYNSYKIFIMKTMLLISKSKVETEGYSFSQNSTHYILSQNNKIINNQAIIPAQNVFSTINTGSITLTTFDSVYPVETKTIELNQVQPLIIGVSSNIGNRTVGVSTNLDIIVNRNNEGGYGETDLIIELPVGGFDYSNAQYQGTLINPNQPTISVPINITSPKIITVQISNLKNILYVPNLQSTQINEINVYTRKGQSQNIGISSIPAYKFIPNDPIDIISSVTRTNDKSGQPTDIKINYQTQYGKSGDILSIILPDGQNQYLSNSKCTIGGQPCTIKSWDSSNVQIQYVYNQSIVLDDVLNSHPNLNKIQFTLKTAEDNGIQESQSIITPPIALQYLHIQSTASSGVAGANNALQFLITSTKLPIQPNNFMLVQLPERTFSRKLAKSDCQIIVNSQKYTGCIYNLDSDKLYLQSVKITSFGPFTIDAKSTFKIKLFVTNPWTAYPFESKTVKFTIYKNQTTALSTGIEPLAEMFGSQSSFSPQSILSSPLTQSNLKANEPNDITVQIKFIGNLYQHGTQILIMVPKDSYSSMTQIGSQTSNSLYTQFHKEDSLYYYTKQTIPTSQCSSSICSGYNFIFTIKIKNNKYIKQSRNNIIVYAIYDDYAATQSYSQEPEIYSTLQPIGLSIERSNNQANQNTEIVLGFYIEKDHGVINIDIGKDIVDKIDQIACSQNGQQLSTNAKVAQKAISLQLSSYENSQRLDVKIVGKNTLWVPIEGLTSFLTIKNQTYLLYQKDDMRFMDTLVPLNEGLALTRLNSTVSQITYLTLTGNIFQQSNLQSIDFSSYGIYVNKIRYDSPLPSPIDMKLNQYTNPDTIESSEKIICEIKNASHIIYKNTEISISPSLVPIIVGENQVSINGPRTAFINEPIDLTIEFQQQKIITEMSLITPNFYQKIIKVVGHSHQQIELLATMQSQNSQGSKILTITNKGDSTFQVNKIIVTLQASQYQTSISSEQEDNIELHWQKPSKIYKSVLNMDIYGEEMNVRVVPDSLRTNDISNYQIEIQTLPTSGVVTVRLPEHISQITDIKDKITVMLGSEQLQNSAFTFTQTDDKKLQISLSIASESSQVQINLSQIQNPKNNKPIVFKVFQKQSSNNQYIYGYRQISIKMEQLDPIFVHLAKRNTTKIGALVKLQLQVETPGYEDEMIVWIPDSQLLVEDQCYVSVDGLEKQCENLSGNRIKITNEPGNHTYTVKGLRNSEFSQKPAQTDKIKIYMGIMYQRAETQPQTTVFITPLVVTGTLSLSGVTSTNNKRAEYTTLTLDVAPENWQKINGIVLVFSEGAYYVHHNLQCQVNNQDTQYMMINHSSIYIEAREMQASKMVISINNLINYYKTGPTIIYTVRLKEEAEGRLLQSVANLYQQDLYGVMDYLQIKNPSISLEPGTPQTRIIFPKNYVSSQAATIIGIIDANFPEQFPRTGLHYSFGSQYLDCQSSNIDFNQTITISCTITKSGQADLYIRLYDSKISNALLAQSKENKQIYEEPTSQCSNQMCDLCSNYQQKEYCFECREDLVSDNGECREECSEGMFSYEGICSQCSPLCQTCYNLYEDNCLSCVSTQVLDSGFCTAQCSETQEFNYNGFCVVQQECQNGDVEGCRVCSKEGFCYQCLPNYKGQPICQYDDILPSSFFIYFTLPFLALLVVFSVVSCYKNGFETYPNLLIYMLAVIELLCWIFTIPRLPEQAFSMILLAFILLRVINSIISYQMHYNKIITHRKQSRLLGSQQQPRNNPRNERQSSSDPETENPEPKNKDRNEVRLENANMDPETITCKQRLCRFSAHFLSCDAYQLLMCKIGAPYITIEHHRVFQILNIINRVIIMGFLAYLMTVGTVLDLLIIPGIGIGCGLTILIIRAVRSSCCIELMNRIRT